MSKEIKTLRMDQTLKLEQYNQRIMLHSYEQQITNARRLARFKVRQRLAQGLDANDPDPGPKRREFASQISQELFDSLLFYANSSPVIDEIRAELSLVLAKQVEFTYPPGGLLKIAVREDGKLRPLDHEEQKKARNVLLQLTRKNVDGKLYKTSTGIDTNT